MILKRFFFVLFFFATSCTSSTSSSKQEDLPLPFSSSAKGNGNKKSKILHAIHTGKFDKAIDDLLAKQDDNDFYQTDLLEDLSLALIHQGLKSREKKDQILALYGLGLSQSEKGVILLSSVLDSPDPELQLTALHVLSSFHTEEATRLIEKALRSDYVFIRLEAAYILTMRKTQSAYAQLEALFAKVEPELRPHFPYLFALEGSYPSLQMLRKLLSDSDLKVRSEAIFACTETHREDFLRDIKQFSYDPSPQIEETFSYAMGSFRERSANADLERISRKNTSAALSAAYALYLNGKESSVSVIVDQAKQDNPFALHLLGKVREEKNSLLFEKMRSSDAEVRVNATLALLERKDPLSLQGLPFILIDTPKDVAVLKMFSEGRTLSYYKCFTSAMENLQRNAYAFELSLRLREDILEKTLALSNEAFLDLAHLVFQAQQHDLIPMLVNLLENMRIDQADALLQEQSERLGDPFIRTYATLALFRMHKKGPYRERLLEFLKKHEKADLFEARPSLTFELALKTEEHSITLQERSRLLVETFEAFATEQSEDGLKTLLLAIKNGNAHNRYVLAGLLLRSSL